VATFKVTVYYLYEQKFTLVQH